MAKIFEMNSFRQSKSAKPSSQHELDFSHGRMDRSDFLPINKPERTSLLSPGSSLRSTLDSGARLLLVIGAIYGLYLSGHSIKSRMANPKQDEQLRSRAAPQPSPLGFSKPSPIIPAETARVESTGAPKQTPGAVRHSPSSPPAQYPPMKYEATRKKVFGSCNGELELTVSSLRFRCTNQVDLVFPVAAIAKAHKDGVVLKSGEKYHFMIANHTSGEVQAIFISWLSRVQQSPQANRLSSF